MNFDFFSRLLVFYFFATTQQHTKDEFLDRVKKATSHLIRRQIHEPVTGVGSIVEEVAN